MTTETPLLRAALAGPDGGPACLIYADWLDNEGRHDEAASWRRQVTAFSGRVPSGLECIKIWWDAFQAGRLVLLGRLPRRRLRPAIIAAAVNKTLAAIAPVVLRSATSGRIGDDGVTLAASANGAVAGVTGRQILAAFPRGGIGRPLRTPMRTVGY